jgi:hypothetical protein
MSRLQSVLPFAVSGALLLASACHHKPRHDRDASTHPAGSDAGCVDPNDTRCTDGVLIRASINACPQAAFSATPIQARLEQPIIVNSRTVDPEGDALSFAWSAEPDGKFDNPGAPATYYRCASLGRKTLTFQIGDDYDCESTAIGEVNCVDVSEFIRAGTQQLPGMP